MRLKPRIFQGSPANDIFFPENRRLEKAADLFFQRLLENGCSDGRVRHYLAQHRVRLHRYLVETCGWASVPKRTSTALHIPPKKDPNKDAVFVNGVPIGGSLKKALTLRIYLLNKTMKKLDKTTPEGRVRAQVVLDHGRMCIRENLRQLNSFNKMWVGNSVTLTKNNPIAPQ